MAFAAIPVALALAGSPATPVVDPAAYCGERLAVAAGERQVLILSGQVETLIASSAGGADDALALLLSSTPAWGSADSSAQARYCLAAGRAMRLASRGSQQRSQQFLAKALALAAHAGDDQLAADAAWQLALALAGGRAPAARGKRSVASGERIELDSVAGCSLSDATLALSEIRRNVIEDAFACAVQRATIAGDADLHARAALRLARLRGSGPDALEPVLAALTDPGQGDHSLDLARELIFLALDLGGEGDPRLATAASRWQAMVAGDPARVAEAAAMAGRLRGSEGTAQLRQAVFLESQKAAPLDLPRYMLMLAGADPQHADQHIAGAYDALERVRPLQPAVDPLTEESVFHVRMRPVFERAIGATLKAAVQDAAGINRAQIIAEAYRSAELQDVLGSECVPARSPVQPADLLPGEVLLYPLLLDDRIELIYATGDDQAGGARRFRRMPANHAVNRATIAQLSQQMTASLSGTSDDWEGASRALYDALIAPVADLLGEDGTLIVVPDGPLRRVSLAALTAPDGRYLVQQTGLAVVPALSFAEPGREARQPVIVAASLEREIDLPIGRFGRLSGTATEAELAAGLRGVLLRDFTREDLADALVSHPASVLHLATHAAFNGRSERSFVVANGETIALPELREMLAANRLRGEVLDLLVLSACETAVGDDDQAMGLASAAVEAGAESALASLWEVSDSGTLALMDAFYDVYHEGAGRSEALRNAQLALIASDDPALADPGVWSAFTLVGSWR